MSHKHERPTAPPIDVSNVESSFKYFDHKLHNKLKRPLTEYLQTIALKLQRDARGGDVAKKFVEYLDRISEWSKHQVQEETEEIIRCTGARQLNKILENRIKGEVIFINAINNLKGYVDSSESLSIFVPSTHDFVHKVLLYGAREIRRYEDMLDYFVKPSSTKLRPLRDDIYEIWREAIEDAIDNFVMKEDLFNDAPSSLQSKGASKKAAGRAVHGDDEPDGDDGELEYGREEGSEGELEYGSDEGSEGELEYGAVSSSSKRATLRERAARFHEQLAPRKRRRDSDGSEEEGEDEADDDEEHEEHSDDDEEDEADDEPAHVSARALHRRRMEKKERRRQRRLRKRARRLGSRHMHNDHDEEEHGDSEGDEEEEEEEDDGSSLALSGRDGFVSPFKRLFRRSQRHKK